MAASPRVDVDAAVRHLERACPRLARVIDAVGPCTLTARGKGSLFDAVVRSIVYQQLAGAAAATIHRRLCERFGGQSPDAAALAAASDADLRACGLSGQKLGYMRDLSARTLTGEIPWRRLARLSDAQVVEELTRIKGVGEWTVQMLLMFRMGRGDVLPTADLGIRKGVQRAFGLRELPTPNKVATVGERWAPHRTVASWYLWRSLD
jgi:DNA-3-methyladenine glycosylase II